MLAAQSKRKHNVVILHVSETAPPGHELSWIVNQNINFCSPIILWMSFWSIGMMCLVSPTRRLQLAPCRHARVGFIVMEVEIRATILNAVGSDCGGQIDRARSSTQSA